MQYMTHNRVKVVSVRKPRMEEDLRISVTETFGLFVRVSVNLGTRPVKAKTFRDSCRTRIANACCFIL